MKYSPETRRLVIAHNPHSSRASSVKEQVFDRLDGAGYSYETIEVRQAHLNDNVKRLAPLIQPNDIVLSAGGDGSAHAVFHTVVAANQPGVELGFLAYGNFNDIPNTFNTKESLRDPVAFLQAADSETAWPISVFADGKLIRSSMLYTSIGWTAKAAHRFDDPKIRHKITHGGAGIIKSLWRTGLYYLESRSESKLPSFTIGDKRYNRATDVLFANGPTVARLFGSGKHYYRKEVFLCRVLDVRGIIKNIPFLLTALTGRMRGKEMAKAVIKFDTPTTAIMQCDGEVFEMNDIRELVVEKTQQPLKVLTTK